MNTNNEPVKASPIAAALPLDEHIEIITTKFPIYVLIEETEANIMRSDAVLFKKQFYNEYCYLAFDQESGGATFTLFKCDWPSFEKIEDEFLEGFSFAVKDKSETLIILNALV